MGMIFSTKELLRSLCQRLNIWKLDIYTEYLNTLILSSLLDVPESECHWVGSRWVHGQAVLTLHLHVEY